MNAAQDDPPAAREARDAAAPRLAPTPVVAMSEGSEDRAHAARQAYRRRTVARAQRARAETQAMRRERERLALAHAIRRELATLAADASDLHRQAHGAGRAAEQAQVRLASRIERAREALSQADRFGLDPGLAELDPQDRAALGLPDR
jgi:hypothetical protein